MKKLIFVLIAGILLTSCAYDLQSCPTYGGTHIKMTKYGNHAQAKYIRKHRI